jgi:hypothetical protein
MNVFSQQDSAKIKIDVTVQARDLEMVLFFTLQGDRKLEDLDSALLTKWRSPATAPQGTDNVTVNGIELRVWLQAWRLCFENIAAVQEGTATRISDVLKASGQSWLINKVTKDEDARKDTWQALRAIGRKYVKKETTGFE